MTSLRFSGVFLCLAWLAGAVAAEPDYGNAVVQSVTRVYDGDTFRVTIKGWPPIVGERMPVRVQGVDTPEIKGQCAREKQLAQQARQFTVERLRRGQRIELRNIRRGKYFRLLAAVYIDGHSLAEALIEAKLARPYQGGARQGWCP